VCDYSALSDEDLMARAYDGDEPAWEELYRRFFRRLVVYFARRGVAEADSEDLAEDVFLRVVRTRGSPATQFNAARGRFVAWLYGIAWRLWYDSPGHGPGPFPDDASGQGAGDDVPAGDPSPQDLVEARELADAVHEGLRQLPLTLGAVLELSMAGLRLPDIARVLGIPYGTAGNRLHAARQRLRAWLKERGLL